MGIGPGRLIREPWFTKTLRTPLDLIARSGASE